MVLHTQTQNIIFIYTYEEESKIFVSIASLSEINITAFNWHFSNLNILSRINSPDGFFVILEFNRNEFNSYGYKRGGREYNFTSEDLFEYLQGKTSPYGLTVKESGEFFMFNMMIFGSVALALITGASILYLSKNNQEKKDDEE